MADSTSAQSLSAARISSASSFASKGSGAASPSAPFRNRPPLNRSTVAARAAEKPPAFMLRHNSATSPTKAPGWPSHRRSRSEKLVRSGNRPTDCANMQKIQRIRNVATLPGSWRGLAGVPSNAAASLASRAAMPRVTSARRSAGSSVLGSSHTARSRSRMPGSRKSGR